VRPRRKFASGEAPEAGQVWQWEGDDHLFYLVQRNGGYEREGEMWDVINSTTGVTTQIFISAQDRCIPWKRIS